jgi:hypothetical protein
MGGILGNQEKWEVAFDVARLFSILWDIGELLTFRDNIIIRFDSSATSAPQNVTNLRDKLHLVSHTSLPLTITYRNLEAQRQVIKVR